MKTHPIDKLFADASKKQIEKLDVELWQRLETKLDEKQRKAGFFTLFGSQSKILMLSGVAASVVLVMGLYFMLHLPKEKVVAITNHNFNSKIFIPKADLEPRAYIKRQSNITLLPTQKNQVANIEPYETELIDEVEISQIPRIDTVVPLSVNSNEAAIAANNEDEETVEIEIRKARPLKDSAIVKDPNQKSLLSKLNDLRKGRADLPLQSNSKSIIERLSRE